MVRPRLYLYHHQVVAATAHKVQLASPSQEPGAYYLVASFAQKVGGGFLSRLPQLPRPGRETRRRIFGAHAAHLRVQLLRCSLMHQVDALAALLVASPGSGPPGSPNISSRVLGRASSREGRIRETVPMSSGGSGSGPGGGWRRDAPAWRSPCGRRTRSRGTTGRTRPWPHRGRLSPRCSRPLLKRT